MLKFDEYNQLLVTNPFSYDSTSVSSTSVRDTSVFPTFDSSPQDHPLRNRSVSPAHRYSTPGVQAVTVTGSENEIGSSDRLSADIGADEDLVAASEASQGDNDVIRHTVGPNDSFAGLALRYGVSIAAIRRANQLWPSDPIHLRTEILITRRDAPRSSCKPIPLGVTDSSLGSTAEPAPGLLPFTSPLISLRHMILSLPARMSLESLSSKASTSEDHEMDDFRAARSHEALTYVTRFAEEGYELPTLKAQYEQPSVSLESPRAYLPHNDQHLAFNHIPSVPDVHSRSVYSSTVVTPDKHSRKQPFAALPVRTSQLEPEPAMELPVRRSRI